MRTLLHLDDIPGPGALWRGQHKLPHQCQQIRRDLHGEEILLAPGARVHAYMLTDEQVEDRRFGRRPGMPYRFLVYSPQSAALNWTAFRDEPGLRAFIDAYAMTIEGDLTPGKPFHIRLPESDSHWLAVRRAEQANGSPLAGLRPDQIESLVRLAVTAEIEYGPGGPIDRRSAYGRALNSFTDPAELRALARSLATPLGLTDA